MHINNTIVKRGLQLLLLFTIAFTFTTVLTNSVISKDVVVGTSMEPTLMNGDHVISLRNKTVKRNQIVVLYAPDQPHALYTKRIIGIPGDTITSQNDRLYINGKRVSQSYLNHDFISNELSADAALRGPRTARQLFTSNFTLATLATTHRQTVPKNAYFVLGDNRFVSRDSRELGFIKKTAIRSVVAVRYWPLSHFTIF